MKITDYLSEIEMKEIARQAFTDKLQSSDKADWERIVSNAGYKAAQKIVEEILGDNLDNLIATKALEVINNLSEYTVFKRPDPWDSSGSPSYKVMTQAVIDNKDLVAEKVKQAIKNISKKDALDIIKSKDIKLF